MYFYLSRYYDPDAGRFITPDQIGSYSGDSNLYAYVGNNPFNRRDPSGLLTERDFKDGVDVAGTLIGLGFANNPAAGLVMKIFGLIKSSLTTGADPVELYVTGVSMAVTLFGGPVGSLAMLGVQIGNRIIDEYGDSLLALEDSKNSAARSAGLRIRRNGDNNRRRARHANLILLEALCELQKRRDLIESDGRGDKDWRRKNNQSMRKRLREALNEVKKSPADSGAILEGVDELVNVVR